MYIFRQILIYYGIPQENVLIFQSGLEIRRIFRGGANQSRGNERLRKCLELPQKRMVLEVKTKKND